MIKALLLRNTIGIGFGGQRHGEFRIRQTELEPTTMHLNGATKKTLLEGKRMINKTDGWAGTCRSWRSVAVDIFEDDDIGAKG